MQKIDTKMEVETILVHVKKLKEEYQDIILLRYIEGYSVKEAAQILDKKYTHTRVLLHRAMKKLQEIISV
jgi:RNA polymerase sigma-70 factor (ECF subfamily)